MYYSLHQRLTNILSTYLEFDAEQLELGLWNGDLHIKDGVNLRSDAFDPLLSSLDLRMLSGSVGKLHAQIPWNTLLEGSKCSVHLSDINIVLCFSPKNLQSFGVSREYSEQAGHSPRVSSREKQLKRKRIDDAEQRLYKGAEKLSLQEFIERTKCIKNLPKRSFLNQLLYKLASSLAWRLASSFHAKIERIKITIVQDGISVGVSLDMLNVTNGIVEGKAFCPLEESGQAQNGEEVQSQYWKEVCGSKVHELFFGSATQCITKRMEVIGFGVFIMDLRRQWVDKDSEFGDYPLYQQRRTLLENLFPTESDYLVLPTGLNLSLNLGLIDTLSSFPGNSKEGGSGSVTSLSAAMAFVIRFGYITLSVSRYQHRSFLDFFSLSRNYVNGRPSCSILADHKHPFHLMFDADGEQCYKPRRSIQQWWQYAFRCVVSELRSSRGSNYRWRAEKRTKEAYISAFSSSFLCEAAPDSKMTDKFKDGRCSLFTASD